MDNASDRQLIEQARQCSREAFDRLVELYTKPLIGFLRGRGVKQQDTEDLAQEVWIKVWVRIHRSVRDGGYDPAKGRFYTWVINCFAKYSLLDWMSRRHELCGLASGGADEERDLRIEPFVEPNPDTEEDRRLSLLAFGELFRVTFLCGGYPHEQLAFGFAKLICGTESTRAVEGGPQRVDAEYGKVSLGVLTQKFWDSYRIVSSIGDPATLELLERCLDPVQVRLELTVQRLIQPLAQHLVPVRKDVTARTSLRDYYPRRPDDKQGRANHPITDWCYRVKEKVRRVKLEAEDTGKGPTELQDCRRCKLRRVPPCDRHNDPEPMTEPR